MKIADMQAIRDRMIANQRRYIEPYERLEGHLLFVRGERYLGTAEIMHNFLEQRLEAHITLHHPDGTTYPIGPRPLEDLTRCCDDPVGV